MQDLIKECEREQLHLSGTIQPFGALLAGTPGDPEIKFCSANIERYLGKPPSELLGQSLYKIITSAESKINSIPKARKLLYNLDIGHDVPVDAVFFQSDKSWLLELFEKPEWVISSEIELFEFQSSLLGNPVYSGKLQSQYDQLIDMIKQLTSFDRVMLYQFLPDGSGGVVSELNEGFDEAYLGLRFPASDIPQIARKLYEVNPYRSIPDTNQENVPIIAKDDSTTLDLTHSDLRSVSPVHIQYLDNMGVESSLSFSIIIKSQLWGLVACHSQQARQLPINIKEACSSLIHSFSMSMNAYNAEQQLKYIDRADHYADQIDQLLRAILANKTVEPLAKDIMQSVEANGIAIHLDKTICFGKTPGLSDINTLVKWIQEEICEEHFFHCEALGDQFEPAQAYTDVASGILFVQLEKVRDNDSGKWMIWFRPELPQIIKWAGEPHKLQLEAEQPGEPPRLMPRTSFALWQEKTRGKSKAWNSQHLMMTKRFRFIGLRTILDN